jgi:ATP-binding cassette subfamily B protein
MTSAIPTLIPNPRSFGEDQPFEFASPVSPRLATKVASSGNSISLGQKQLIAFMRATLRRPELLILDEATANIDTVTEQLSGAPEDHLGDHRAPSEHHRQRGPDLFRQLRRTEVAGSMEHAVDMLLHHKRES